MKFIGGEDMVELGYIEFTRTRPWLTRKGCDVFYAAMEIIPQGNCLAKAPDEGDA